MSESSSKEISSYLRTEEWHKSGTKLTLAIKDQDLVRVEVDDKVVWRKDESKRTV